jgi:hypothetical protein
MAKEINYDLLAQDSEEEAYVYVLTATHDIWKRCKADLVLFLQ